MDEAKDAKANDAEYQWLKANRAKVARSNDKAAIADFNARHERYYGHSRASNGTYAEFAGASGRGHDMQVSTADNNARLQAQYDARRGKTITGSMPKEAVN